MPDCFSWHGIASLKGNFYKEREIGVLITPSVFLWGQWSSTLKPMPCGRHTALKGLILRFILMHLDVML
jgi:hypothetical protein